MRLPILFRNRSHRFLVLVILSVSLGLVPRQLLISNLYSNSNLSFQVLSVDKQITASDSALDSKLNKSFSDSNVVSRQPNDAKVVKLWKKYQREHSQGALVREWQNKDTVILHNNNPRRFAIGYYSCPLQAGNRLHHFFNALIWAVATNRTLLWKYYDKKTCLRVGARYSSTICRAANTAADCAKVLHRAHWLPSFNEWGSKWNFSSIESLSYWTTHEASHNHKFWTKGAEHMAGRADSTESLVVDFPQMLGQDAGILKSERKRKMLFTTTAARDRAEQLFGAGPDYLYGLLFHECFSFLPHVSVPIISPFTNSSNHTSNTWDAVSSGVGNASIVESVTIVLHSRHSKADDDGSKIKREKKCLDRILQPASKGTTILCQVILLSDRPHTLEKATEYLAQRYPHCLAMVAPHDFGLSFLGEHGPFAGAGFFQDLALVSNQTLHVPTSINAFVGHKHRSSSELVRELMVYQLYQQQPRYQQHASPELATCFLEDM
jgi:hypothetical protein